MPVTSSRSSLKRWPRPDVVLDAAAAWGRRLAAERPEVVAVGCIGSYARGDAGVGSDLDVVIVRRDGTPRPDLLGADVAALPVPVDALHYTVSELARVLGGGGRMAGVLVGEARWWVGGLPGVPREDLLAWLVEASADPGLRDDLASLVPEGVDDRDPP